RLLRRVATFLLNSARQRDSMTLTYPNPPVQPVRTNTKGDFGLPENMARANSISNPALPSAAWRIWKPASKANPKAVSNIVEVMATGGTILAGRYQFPEPA